MFNTCKVSISLALLTLPEPILSEPPIATEFGIFYNVLMSGKILSFVEEDLVKKEK